jgi:hypothetical protein
MYSYEHSASQKFLVAEEAPFFRVWRGPEDSRRLVGSRDGKQRQIGQDVLDPNHGSRLSKGAAATRRNANGWKRSVAVGLFQRDFLRPFIIPPTQERCLAQFPAVRPFRASDFADQLRLDPLDLLFSLRQVLKR